MIDVNISDSVLSSAVREWLALDGLTDFDCAVSDVSYARSAGDSRPTVVLYPSADYLLSDVHLSLGERLGSRYAAVPLPLSLGKLSSAVRTVTAVLSETTEPKPSPSEKPCLMLSRGDRTVTYLGTTVTLTEREFALLEYLAERANTAVSRDELRANVWGDAAGSKTNAVDVYVSYLRRKVGALLGKGAIVSVRGDGYMLII